MAEALKNLYSETLIKKLSTNIKKNYNKFDMNGFNTTILNNDWQNLELKARMRRVAEVLGEHLPPDFQTAIDILLPVSKEFSGLEHMFFPDFIEVFGLAYFKESMLALEILTAGSSAEFAIRPFILESPEKTMQQMLAWSKSDDEHVRRLASEGCRPRLPWAMALPEFKKNPAAVLPVIHQLINDQSLYVRRSVANNLNDISKDNPQIVIDISKQYLGHSAEVNWVIKHACRGLLKQGNKEVLALFGYTQTNHIRLNNFKVDPKICLGDQFNFEFELSASEQLLGKLRIEFIIHFKKSNGKQSAKIFKISEGVYPQNKRSIKKYFSFKPVSTRQYYPGEHAISIVINGNKIVTRQFELVV